MTKVRLEGLKIYRKAQSGKWYVYFRANGRPLVQSFEGSRIELDSLLSTPSFLKLYSEVAEKPKQKGFGTLGGLFDFYKTKDRWRRLAPRTQVDYQKVIDWLDEKKQLSTPILSITPADMATTRDKAAKDKYAKFSNDALACLSAAFEAGREYGYARLTANPVKGIRRIHKNSKTANRRWTKEEWSKVWRIAPKHIRPALALARWTGARGQDIVSLRWDNIAENKDLGLFLEYNAKKNKADCVVAILPDLHAVLDGEDKTTLTICKNSLGRPYPSENAMRKVWQDFKASPIFDNLIPTGADLTLHGLRVTYASELKENGFSDEDVAKALGDRSTSMGKHYGRGADALQFAKRVKNAKMG